MLLSLLSFSRRAYASKLNPFSLRTSRAANTAGSMVCSYFFETTFNQTVHRNLIQDIARAFMIFRTYLYGLMDYLPASFWNMAQPILKVKAFPTPRISTLSAPTTLKFIKR
jgi:hypothetical protein